MSQFIKIPKIVYHGTTSGSIDSIVNGIDINHGDERVDFGRGFYTTTHYSQAVIWGISTANKHNIAQEVKKQTTRGYKPKLVTPSVITFLVDVEQLCSLENSYTFHFPDEEWSEFIYNNRKKVIHSTPFHNWDQKYDYIYGPMGDGALAKNLNKYQKGLIDLSKLAQEIIPGYAEGTTLLQDQLSFHTEQAIQCLTLKGVKKNAVPQYFTRRY